MPIDWLGVALGGIIATTTTRRKEGTAVHIAVSLFCLGATAFLFLRADSLWLYAGSSITVMIMVYCQLAVGRPYHSDRSYQPAIRSGLHDAAAHFLAEKYQHSTAGRIEISAHAAGVRITCIERHRVHDVSFLSRLCIHCSVVATIELALGVHAQACASNYLRALNSRKSPVIVLRYTPKGLKITCLRKRRDRLATDCLLHQ